MRVAVLGDKSEIQIHLLIQVLGDADLFQFQRLALFGRISEDARAQRHKSRSEKTTFSQQTHRVQPVIPSL